QVLMASTYPLEIVQAARWAKANPNVKDKALEDAMAQQSWDPSVKSLTSVPQTLQMMSDRLEWTQQLGDAFLAQKDAVMAAVQNLRARAKDAGKLDTTQQQKVSTEPAPASPATGDRSEVIVIESVQPDIVYVPTYNPAVVYGAWPYPAYRPMSWYPPGYVASNLISFGVGVAVGAAIWGRCDWNRGDVNINVNRYNNFNRTNITNNNWNHNELHRKGVPYRDRSVAQRFNKGGRSDAASRDRFRGRQESSLPGRDRPGASPGDRNRPAARPGNANRPAARPGGVDRGTAHRTQQANRPTGLHQPRANQNIGRGHEVRANSARGATSRAHSHTRNPPARSAPTRSAAPRGRR
ncbi:MAG: DUF3300 domain-containing protein, partial [Alphaproteobacteria bacterium]